MTTVEQIIEKLKLEKHVEGGYFQRTFYSDTEITVNGKSRRQMSAIYYLLTRESHLSYFACNQSDLMLFYHLGDPLKIVFLSEQGNIREKILGPDLMAGHVLQVACPGNCMKAYDLMDGEFCLVGEALAPGFEYEDLYMPSRAQIIERTDQLHAIQQYVLGHQQ